MRRIVSWLAAAAVLAAAPVLAQTPLRPPTPGILTWKGERQAVGYRTIETIYRTHTIRRGATVHPLPKAAHQIDPTFSFAGKTWTLADYMKAYRVSGLLVVKDGKIVLERYGLGRKPTDRWTSFSVAKSVTSTLVGAAIEDGKIKGLNAAVTDYIPQLKGSAYDGVTVRQMLMMSSGVKWNEDYVDPNSDVAQAGLKILEPGVDPMVSYLRRLPRDKAPGSTFHYNTGETDLVGILVANAVGEPLAQYASEKIWKPYGMERDAVWMTDLAGHERGGCCISMTLRDYARVGQFILDGGKADGKPVVPPGWVAQATSKEIDNDSKEPGAGYGYFWWIRSPDRYEAVGIFGQSISIFPKDRLIVVQNAAWPRATGKDLSAARNAMIEAVRKAAAQ
jgi:CubicO group peptidase (beta-lactamase class C family)